MKKFDFHSPGTVAECIDLLDQHQDSVSIVSGGTDVVIEYNEESIAPAHVIDIKHIDELHYFKVEDGYVKIGPTMTFTELENTPYVREKLPAMYETVCHVGSPQIRNLGTIGGNVVSASVAGDSPTTLITYGAEVVLTSKSGERIMSLETFNEGPGNCAIRPDELLTQIRFPEPTADEAVGYFKVGKRKSLAIVVLAVCIYMKKNAENRIENCRVILGAVNKHPMRAPKIEEAMKGMLITRGELEKTLPLFTEAINEAIPTRASVVYKREGVRGAAHICFDMILEQFGLE